MTYLYIYTFLAMMHFAPPERAPQFPGYEESHEAAVERYAEIAWTIAGVCEDAPSPRRCASLLVAIGVGESYFARDADIGPCYRVGVHRTRCDSGLAASVWQAQAFGVDDDGQPITVARLFASRKLAATHVLRVARASLRQCRKLEPVDQLSGLSGRCQVGLKSAQSRWRLWQTIQSWEHSL